MLHITVWGPPYLMRIRPSCLMSNKQPQNTEKKYSSSEEAGSSADFPSKAPTWCFRCSFVTPISGFLPQHPLATLTHILKWKPRPPPTANGLPPPWPNEVYFSLAEIGECNYAKCHFFTRAKTGNHRSRLFQASHAPPTWRNVSSDPVLFIRPM